jgi:hypothetical protein
MMLGLFGDAVVAALLIATISYAAVLNSRLGVLRGDRAKLEELVNGLTVAADRADAGIAGLKEAAEDVGRGLERKIEEGRGLRDDLAYMLERGGHIADRLEGTIRARRDGSPPERKRERERDPKIELEPRAPTPGAPKLVADGPAVPSRAERELLRALGGR